MDTLRLAHQFFIFSLKDQQRLWPARSPSWEEISLLFAGGILPRRSLALGEVGSTSAARELMGSIIREEYELGIRALPAQDFPESLLRYIPPDRLPAFLYLRGADLPSEASCVGVVGTRRPSLGGADAAANFAAFFSSLHLRVVSGLARGIDTIAHRENIAVGTVAVLGSGVGIVYPKENQDLAEDLIAQAGTLVSPFPLYQVPLPQNFPARNELIAALACGTVVIEGAEQSGAAVTGKHALAMGKTVVTLTQDFRTDFGRGAIRLQQAGAVLVANEEEALQALYAPLGGFARGDKLEKFHRAIFRFADFHQSIGNSHHEAVVLLEEAILRGRIERVGVDRYRLGNQRK